MGLVATKPVFGISYKARLEPVSSATSYVEIRTSLVASLYMILSNKRITKALIRLCGCPGWSVPLLFANMEDRFSHVEAHMASHLGLLCLPVSRKKDDRRVWFNIDTKYC